VFGAALKRWNDKAELREIRRQELFGAQAPVGSTLLKPPADTPEERAPSSTAVVAEGFGSRLAKALTASRRAGSVQEPAAARTLAAGASTGFSFGSALAPASVGAAPAARTVGASNGHDFDFAPESDGDSQQEEDKELADERAKVKAVFAKLNPSKPGTIAGSQFPALFEALGTTYSEVGHNKRLAELSDAHGNVSLQRFTAWYEVWPFDGDDDSVTSDAESTADASTSTAAAPTSNGFGAQFKAAAGSWRCESCLITNTADKVKCAACEVPNPAAPAAEAAAVPAAAASNGSISSSGFTFGSPAAPSAAAAAGSGAISSSGFSFGAAVEQSSGSSGAGIAEPAAVAPTARSSGFSFGSAFAPPVFGAAPAAAAVAGGFSFTPAAAQPATDGPAAANAAATAAAAVDSEGFTEPATAAAAGAEHSGDVSDFAPEHGGSDVDSQQDEEQERADERAKVVAAFAKLSPSQPGMIAGSQFPALFEALGTTYCEEEHTRTLAALSDADDNVSLERFSEWFDNWLFADDDSVSGDAGAAADSTTNSSTAAAGITDSTTTAAGTTDAAVTAAAAENGFGAQFKAAADSWRCDSCCVTNTADNVKCVACEARNPAAPAEAAAAAVPAAASSDSISSSGFSFGAHIAATSAMPAQSDSSNSSSSAIGASGFSFGSAFTGSAFGAAPGAAAAPGGFSFTRAATAAAAPPAAADVIAEESAGNAASADAVTAPVATAEAAPAPAPAAAADNARSEQSISDADSQQDEEKERVEERAKVVAAFAKLNPSQPGMIAGSQFPALFEALGTTYSEVGHHKRLVELSDADGNVSQQRFSDWYENWLYADDDSVGSDAGAAADTITDSTTTAGTTTAAAAASTGFGTQFKAPAGSWRCDSCCVTNTADKVKCVACETRNPAAPAEAAAASMPAAASSGSISSSGFSFGAPVAVTAAMPAQSDNSNSSSSSSAVGATGFSFGSAFAPPVFGAAPAVASGGFSFIPAAAAAAQPVTDGTAAADATAAAAAAVDTEGSTEPATAADAAAATTVQLTDNDSDFAPDEAGSDADSQQEEEKERADERAKVVAAFAKLSPSQPGMIAGSQFPALFEALGTTYSEVGHHKRLVELSDADGNVSLERFSDWYENWLYADDDSVSSDASAAADSATDSATDSTATAGITEAAAAARTGFGTQFKAAAGSWRCDSCCVTNTADMFKCVACETPNPAAPAAAAAASMPAAASSGSISSSGFSFGAPVAAAAAIPAQSDSSNNSSSSSAIGATGFSFGSAFTSPVFGATPAATAAPVAASSGFTFTPAVAVVADESATAAAGDVITDHADADADAVDDNRNDGVATDADSSSGAVSGEAVTAGTAGDNDGNDDVDTAADSAAADTTLAAAVPAAAVPAAGSGSSDSSISNTGFSFGSAFAAPPSSGAAPSAAAAPTSGFSFTPATAAAPTVQLTDNDSDFAPDEGGSDADSQQQEDQERADERAKVVAAFAKLNPSQPSMIAGAQFPALFEALGTTYSEVGHNKRLVELSDADGNVSLQRFSDWYENWLYADDDSVTSDAGSTSATTDSTTAAAAGSNAFGEQFKAAAGSWRCDSCCVTNTADNVKCVACEARNPAAPAEAAAAAAAGPAVASSGSISSSGFSFGAPAAATTAIPVLADNSSSSSAIGTTGFSFGSAFTAPVFGGTSAATAVPVAASGGFTFTPATAVVADQDAAAIAGDVFADHADADAVHDAGNDGVATDAESSSGTVSDEAAASATAGDNDDSDDVDTAADSAADTTLAAAAVPAASSGSSDSSISNTGFSFGGAFTAPPSSGAAPATTAAAATSGFSFTPAAAATAVQLTDNDSDFAPDEGGSDADSQQDEEKERVEERAKVAAAFAKLNPSQPSMIAGAQFPALFEALGTTYSEVGHNKRLVELSDADGNVSLQRFSEWYMNWLYADDDSVTSDAGSASASTDNSTAPTAAASSGFGEQFKAAAGSWRCDSCCVTNTADKVKCVACETRNPAAPAEAAAAAGPTVASSGSISSSGFSFGVPAAALVQSSSSSNTGISSGNTGFSFGGAFTAPSFSTAPAAAAPGGFTFAPAAVAAAAPAAVAQPAADVMSDHADSRNVSSDVTAPAAATAAAAATESADGDASHSDAEEAVISVTVRPHIAGSPTTAASTAASTAATAGADVGSADEHYDDDAEHPAAADVYIRGARAGSNSALSAVSEGSSESSHRHLDDTEAQQGIRAAFEAHSLDGDIERIAGEDLAYVSVHTIAYTLVFTVYDVLASHCLLDVHVGIDYL
jgi:trimeric autotransporter adhesin